MTLQELEKSFGELQSSISVLKKDFDLKLDAANKNAESWKAAAEQKQAELVKYQEDVKKANEDRDKALSEARVSEIKSFVEASVKEGKISPAAKDIVEKLMQSMTGDANIATFEQKDGKKVQHTQLSLFKEFIATMAKSPIFRQMSRSGEVQKSATPAGSEEQQFTEVISGGQKKILPADGQDLHLKAIELQEESRKIGKTLSYEDALIQASIAVKVDA